MFRKVSEERASCIEEKKALERAKRRLQEAETKVEAIAHWVVAVEKAVNEYRGSRSQFGNWLEVDFPKAVAVAGMHRVRDKLRPHRDAGGRSLRPRCKRRRFPPLKKNPLGRGGQPGTGIRAKTKPD